MKQIKEAIIKACSEHPNECPPEIDATTLADALEMLVSGIARLMSDAEKGEPVSKLMGMSPEDLAEVRAWCRVAVLTKSKGEALAGTCAQGWPVGKAAYAAYWIGLYEAGLR